MVVSPFSVFCRRQALSRNFLSDYKNGADYTPDFFAAQGEKLLR